MRAQSVSMNIDTGEKTWLTPKWIIDVLGAFDLAARNECNICKLNWLYAEAEK